MKKILLFSIFILFTVISSRADDYQKLKEAIISQILSNKQEKEFIEKLKKDNNSYDKDAIKILDKSISLSIPSDESISVLLSKINDNGSWNSVDYASTDRSFWGAQHHIDNIYQLAKAYSYKNSKYYKNRKVLNAIIQSIMYWCDTKLICSNWWYNEIGVPQVLAPTLLLIEDDLPSKLKDRAIKVLDPADNEKTGQNKVWLMGITFMKGILLKDDTLLQRTSNAIKEEVRFSEQEGIKKDYTFHQHGILMQNGGYGLNFASSISYWMRIFNHTTYDFSIEQKNLMRQYIIQGLNKTVWKGSMDVSSCGRQLFVNVLQNKAVLLLKSNINMALVDKIGEKSYEEYIIRNFISPQHNNLVGNFQFPISKYAVHRSDKFMFSVRMFSKTVSGGEIINNENLKGYYLGDGTTMINVNGDEYKDIYPIWNGKYMPGTTVAFNEEPLKKIKHSKFYINGSDFSGGVSNGKFGVSAIKYIRDGVKANKSWFFLDSVVVCLGNNITSDKGEPLITTLNQCNFFNEAYYIDNNNQSNKIADNKIYLSKKVYCDNIGYESLDSSNIECIIKKQTGSWHDVALFYDSTEVKGNVFTAQIHHNKNENGNYAYIVKPGISKKSFFSDDKRSYNIIQNDDKASIIELKDNKMVIAVFWQSDQVSTKQYKSIKASGPAMVIIKNNGNIIDKKVYSTSCHNVDVVVIKN